MINVLESEKGLLLDINAYTIIDTNYRVYSKLQGMDYYTCIGTIDPDDLKHFKQQDIHIESIKRVVILGEAKLGVKQLTDPVAVFYDLPIDKQIEALKELLKLKDEIRLLRNSNRFTNED